MPGIVSETHWIERQCEQIREEIRRKHQAGLEHPDEGIRKKTRKQVAREIRLAVQTYLKSAPRRPLPHGTILH